MHMYAPHLTSHDFPVHKTISCSVRGVFALNRPFSPHSLCLDPPEHTRRVHQQELLMHCFQGVETCCLQDLGKAAKVLDARWPDECQHGTPIALQPPLNAVRMAKHRRRRIVSTWCECWWNGGVVEPQRFKVKNERAAM